LFCKRPTARTPHHDGAQLARCRARRFEVVQRLLVVRVVEAAEVEARNLDVPRRRGGVSRRFLFAP
jgi:hypothetical protein